MKVKCAECGKRYKIKDSLVAPQGIKVRCPNCNTVIPIYLDFPNKDTEKTQLGDSTVESTQHSKTPMPDETTPFITPTGAISEQEEELDASAIQSNTDAEEYEATHVQSGEFQQRPQRTTETPTLNNRPLSQSGVTKKSTFGLDDVDDDTYEEISLPGEISQVSFDSDATFRDNPEVLVKGGAAKQASTSPNRPEPSAKPSGKPPLGPTIINPKPPIHGDMSAQAPTAILNKNFAAARQQREETQASARQPNNLQLKMIIAGVLLLAGLIYWQFFNKPSPGRPDSETSVTATPTPAAVAVPTTRISDADRAIVFAAINYASEASMMYAAQYLAERPNIPGVQAWIAYVEALRLVCFNDTAARDRGLQAVNAALLEDAQQPQALLASGLLTNSEMSAAAFANLQQKLSDLQKNNLVQKQELNFLLIYNHLQNQRDTAAKAFIDQDLTQGELFGPTLLVARRIPEYKESQRISDLLSETRTELLRQQPELARFVETAPSVVPTVAPKAVKTPAAKVTVRPTVPRTRNIPTPTTSTANKNDQFNLLLARGDNFFKNEQYNEALNVFKEAGALKNNADPVILLRLGFTWYKLYRLDEAYTQFNRAASLDANLADAHKGLGMVYDQLGDVDKAIREFSLYLQLKPNAPDAAEIRDNLKKLKQ